MKRVLYLHHAIGVGGAPRSLALLLAGLDRSRFEPIVVVPERKGNQAVVDILRRADVEVHQRRNLRPFHGSYVPLRRRLWKRMHAVYGYSKTKRCAVELLETFQPDLLHLNSTCLVAAAVGAKQSSCIPVIAHVREPLMPDWWGRLVAKWNRTFVDFFIGIDQHGLDTLNLKNGNSEVVFNCVDTQSMQADAGTRDAERAKAGWKKDDVVFLFLARVTSFNGPLELVRLVQQNQRQLDPRARFVIAGFSVKQDAYAEEVWKLSSSTTRVTPVNFSSDPRSLLNSADCVVVPFLTPHSARSVLEGAALAKPALVSNQPNLLELVQTEKAGLAFQLNDPASFVSGVNRICDDALRSRFSLAALERARQEFDSHANVERTMAIYDRLLALPGSNNEHRASHASGSRGIQ